MFLNVKIHLYVEAYSKDYTKINFLIEEHI